MKSENERVDVRTKKKAQEQREKKKVQGSEMRQGRKKNNDT